MSYDQTFKVSKSAIQTSDDFHRIVALPRRPAPLCDKVDAITEHVSQHFRMPNSKAILLPVQAYTLLEIEKCAGFFGPITVGGGKTLITLLASKVLGAKRPLLILPGGLMGADLESKIRSYGRDWQIARNLRVISYDALSRVGGDKLLIGADLLIFDEGHRLKNLRAACTRKVAHFMAEHPTTPCIALSGTFRTHSMIKDCSHIAMWCLKQGSPFPMAKSAVYEWAEALDQQVNGFRRDPGVLFSLTPGVEDAKEGFRRRLVDTSGVIVAGGEDVSASIRVSALPYQVGATTSSHFENLRTLAERPDGYALTEQVRVWAHARELALGFHSAWDPWAPQEWLDARKGWARYVREVLARNTPGLDSELGVVNHVDRMGGIGLGLLIQWREIRETFKVNPKDTWHDFTALDLAASWGKKAGTGIIWVEHVFFGKELSKRTGWPYYGAAGLDQRGDSITVSQSKIIIASVDANKTGRNLQDRWSKNLITSPEGLAKDWEQIMGRTHRLGQQADEVTFDVFLGCKEHNDSFNKAVEGAKAEKQILGTTQKLLLADICWTNILPNGGKDWQWKST